MSKCRLSNWGAIEKKLRFAKVPSNSCSIVTVNFCWSFWRFFRRPNDCFGVGVHAAMCRSIGWYGRNTLYQELMTRYLTTMAIVCSCTQKIRTFLIGKLSPKNVQSVPSSFKHLHLRGALIRETAVPWKPVTYSFCACVHVYIMFIVYWCYCSDAKLIILGSANVGKTCLLQRYLTGNFAETISVSLWWDISCDTRLQIKRGIDLPCWAQMI